MKQIVFQPNYERMFLNAVLTLVAVGEAAGVRGEDQCNGSLEIIVAIDKLKERRARAQSEVGRLRAERDALQQRLNVADQRVDDLETEVEALESALGEKQAFAEMFYQKQLLAETRMKNAESARDALQQRLNVAGPRVDALETENAALCTTVKRSAMRIKELDLLFGRYLLGMRAAVIELEHGQGAESAMQWIVNGLAGPGEFAPDDATDAQAYFDREIEAVDAGMAEVMAFLEQDRREATHG